MYKLIGSRKSRAFRVLWTLEELEVPYEHVPALPRSDEVRAVSPTGKVPVLVEGPDVLTDSVAIMSYLADKHGALTFPAGTPDRARLDARLHKLNEDFDTLLWAAAKHSFVLPEERRVPAVKDSLRWQFRQSCEAAEAALEGPYLLGETMTIADILLVHCLGWALVAKFPLESDALKAYSRRLRDRPAYQRAAELA